MHPVATIATILVGAIAGIALFIFTRKEEERPYQNSNDSTYDYPYHDRPRSAFSSSNQVEQCSICCAELIEGVRIMSCGHQFHSGCINEWRKKSNTCPNCRKSL